jgi:hypothetical protein
MRILNQEIADRIKLYPQEGQLPCAVAHYIAAELGVTPLEVGQTADEMGVRVTMCQLGLFGYARKGRPAYRIRTPMEHVPEDLANAIREATVDGRAPCAAVWQIAEAFDLSRLEMGNAVEGLGIKVKPCQLGFF